MSEIRDNFCKTLDHSDLGVTGTMKKFSSLLQETDYEVWEHLVGDSGDRFDLLTTAAGKPKYESTVLQLPMDNVIVVPRV